MNITRTLLLSSLLMVGCVRSVHPFVSESQRVFDPALVGLWTQVTESDDKQTFAITGDAEAKQYQVLYKDGDGKTGGFVVQLAKIGDQTLADVYPKDLKTADSGVYGAHFMPLHSFMLVSYNAGSLKFRAMDPNWLRKQLEAQPALLKHETIEDQIILTAPTQQLQEFVLKHVTSEGAYGDSQEFKWTGPTTRP